MRTREWIVLVLGLAFMVLTTIAAADGPPKVIEIKVLENLYGPARFDHDMHTGTAENCKSCHHKPFGKTMPCKDCHDEPVAKKDFKHESHWEYDSCESCHQVKSTKELACSACHKVPFDEKNLKVIGLKGALHAQCMDCHKENEVDNSCSACHAKK